MYRLIYSSVSKDDLPPAEISEILRTSRRRNEGDEITGLLLYHDRCVLQVLEGPRDNVEACYERISRDPRHGQLRVLSRKGAKTKLFSKWFMGYDSPEGLSALGRASTITLDQLESRLTEVENVDVPDGKKEAIQLLSRYLVSQRAREKAAA